MFDFLKEDKYYPKLVPLIRRYARFKFYVNYIPFRLFSRKGKLENLYFATIQKSGSQWLKAILDDARIREYTKLKSYPQHHYDGNEFHEIFPRYTFIPGVYLSYPIFWKFVNKPENYKVIYVIRDPRNIVVSWYHSVLKTHRALPGVLLMREKLKQLSIEEGLIYGIKHLGYKFAEMRSWIELSHEDDKVLIVKFEDLIENSQENLVTLFEFLEIEIPKKVIENVVKDYTKDKMRERDLEKRENKESHYRKQSSDHKGVFKEKHYRLFDEINGNLLEVLDYK